MLQLLCHWITVVLLFEVFHQVILKLILGISYLILLSSSLIHTSQSDILLKFKSSLSSSYHNIIKSESLLNNKTIP